MKTYDVYYIESELRFYPADGWTLDLLESILDQGQLQYYSERASEDNRSYFRLCPNPSPASFNLDRLRDLTRYLLDHKGRTIGPRERAMILKYYSCHGIFLHGDDPAWKRRGPKRSREADGEREEK